MSDEMSEVFDGLLDGVELSSPAPGVILQTHSAAVCAGDVCCIHNPSEHHMRDWKLTHLVDLPFRVIAVNPAEVGIGRHFCASYRECEHGLGHPDPDSLAFARKIGGDVLATLAEVHECDGCCEVDTEMGVTEP
jgi:hypothetical protein